MDRKIRVAHIIARMVTGGAEENTLFTVAGLNKEKYEVDLVVGDEFRENILNNVKEKDFKIIQVRGLKGPLNFFYDPIILFKLIILIKKGHYDIVHTHTTKTGILGRIAAYITGVPIIISGLHGSAYEAFDSKLLNWALIFFEKTTGKFTDAYISVSELLSEKYKEEGIGVQSKYFTVHSGMELDKFFNVREKVDPKRKLAELGINLEPEYFVIGNVGRLEKVKGHKFLIDAFEKVQEKRKDRLFKLIIIGEGEEKENLIKYVKKLELEDKVIFAGYRKDIEELMAIMDIFALTSLREGLPRVLVQAAAVGVPSVAFNVDGVPEIVKDGYNGFLVKPKDVEDLADRIIRYIDNRELISLHGQRGREFVKGKWSIEDMVNKIDEIYQKLIKEKIEV
ncbi:glycosyltransferase family 4 protein [bacterium]|nr:glycosyltransferase family 4 protein [bacterium]MBU4511035.1 glycosyltransferase family 4 protein [bacterium]